MNYTKIHDKIIALAQNRTLPGDKYRECHHIIPRCMGGSNEAENIVQLTAREHYVIHQLLVKMYPDHKGLVFAAVKMTCASKTNVRMNNRIYEWLRVKHSKNVSSRNRINWSNKDYRDYMSTAVSNHNTKRWQQPEYREKMIHRSREYWSKPENRKKASKQRTGKNNGSYGKYWYHHPETLNNLKCKPEEVPEGYVKGRKLILGDNSCENSSCIICQNKTESPYRKYCKKHKNKKCVVCGEITSSQRAKYCDAHRPQNVTNKDLVDALVKHGNIRKALLEVGIAPKGNNYSRVKKLIKEYNLPVKLKSGRPSKNT